MKLLGTLSAFNRVYFYRLWPWGGGDIIAIYRLLLDQDFRSLMSLSTPLLADLVSGVSLNMSFLPWQPSSPLSFIPLVIAVNRTASPPPGDLRVLWKVRCSVTAFCMWWSMLYLSFALGPVLTKGKALPVRVTFTSPCLRKLKSWSRGGLRIAEPPFLITSRRQPISARRWTWVGLFGWFAGSHVGLELATDLTGICVVPGVFPHP